MKSILNVNKMPSSLFSFCEQRIPDPSQRRPLQRICSLMRREFANYLVEHIDLQNHPEFEGCYRGLKEEVTYLKVAAPDAQISVSQISFFSRDNVHPTEGDDKELGLRTLRRLLNEPRISKGEQRLLEERFLGTCALVKVNWPEASATPLWFIAEAYVRPPSVTELGAQISGVSSHIHVTSTFDISIGHRVLNDILCSVYCQQNDFTSSCAHSCLRLAIWHCTRLKWIPSTKSINNFAALRTDSDFFDPADGLTQEQIETVCDKYGVGVFAIPIEQTGAVKVSKATNSAKIVESVDGAKAGKIDRGNGTTATDAYHIFELAYLMAESGLPSFLVIDARPQQRYGTNKANRPPDPLHLMPILGHTLSSDEWYPQAIRRYNILSSGRTKQLGSRRYFGSVEWVPQLIMHDDIMGPYFCIRPDILGSSDPKKVVCPTVGLLSFFNKKRGAALSPSVAQRVASMFFWSLCHDMLHHLPADWKKRLETAWAFRDGKFGDPGLNLVTRVQAVKLSHYIEHLTTIQDHLSCMAITPQNRKAMRHLTLKTLREALCEERGDPLVWIVECTLPELFATNSSKLGEIILPYRFAEPKFAWRVMIDPKFLQKRRPLVFRILNNIRLYPQKRKDIDHVRVNLGFQSHAPLLLRHT